MPKVLFFGAAADIVGSRAIEQPASTTANLLSELARQYPLLGSHKLLISVNQEYAAGDTPLQEGDEVAIFTPVSGG